MRLSGLENSLRQVKLDLAENVPLLPHSLTNPLTRLNQAPPPLLLQIFAT